MRAITVRHVQAQHLFWGCLLLITLAELVTVLLQPYAGLTLHALTLVGLLIQAAFAQSEHVRKLALGLVLAPLIRLLSLSLPLLSFPQLAWYPIVSLPLLLTTWLIVRHVQLSRSQLGLRLGQWLVQLGLAGLGLGLGAIEFAILQPNPLVTGLSWQALWLPALNLLIFTGLTEELIFRGLLQPLARQVLGRWALAYVALLFAVLHVGYLSLSDVVFVFAVGLLFGYIVLWSGSILGVTLAHGLTNIMLLLVLPYRAQQPAPASGRWLDWLIWTGSAVGLVAIGISAAGALRGRRIPSPVMPSGAALRRIRRNDGLSYTELARRSGLSVRELAAIEHGMQPINAEQIQMLVQCIDQPDTRRAD